MISEKELTPVALRPAPASVVNAAGHPAFGTYEGALPSVDLTQLGGPYQLSGARRLLKQKRWHYHLVATPELIAGTAIVDLGYASNAFVVAVELATRKVLVDQSFLGVPGPLSAVGDAPGEGLNARLVAPGGGAFSMRRALGSERYAINVEAMELPFPRRTVSWRGEVLAAGGPPPLTVIAPVGQDGILNVTQKWAGLLAFGKLSAGGKRFSLDGGVAGMDYTQGYLARHTAWHWAMALGRLADGTPVGLNLVEGFNEDSHDSNENALWVGNRLMPLGRARFRFSKRDPLEGWQVRTVDGAVDLRFRPLHVHREERDYKLLRSRFIQPFGTFSGTIRLEGAEVPVQLSGVTEDQDMIW